MSGPLTEGVWPTLLRDLHVRRRSGVLCLEQGDAQRQLRFREGRLVGSRSSVAGESLAAWLVGAGRVSQVDLDQAMSIAARDQSPLGQALLDLGILEQTQLDEALERHLYEQLERSLDGPDGQWLFEERPEARDEDLTYKLSTGELILEAVQRIKDSDLVRFGLGDCDRVLGPSSDPLLRYQQLKLSPEDGYVLSRVDGTLSAREVAQMIPLPAEEVERSLLRLLCTGVIEYLALPPKKAPAARPGSSPSAAGAPRPPAAAAQPPPRVEPPPTPKLSPEVEARRTEIRAAAEALKGANHFEVLGIPRASNESQVKEAYFRLARRFHPDSIRKDSALADLASQAERVFIRIGEASEVLRDQKRRASYEADLASRTPRLPAAPKAAPAETPPPAEPDPEGDARAVEQATKLGERLIAEEKYWDAIQTLEGALPKAQGKSAGRVRYLLSKAFIKNPHWVRRAEELLLVIVRDEPQHIGAHVLLGQIYRQGGLKARAASMYRRVLELNPDHEEAAQALHDMTPAGEAEAQADPEPPQGGGLLKRLFGKG